MSDNVITTKFATTGYIMSVNMQKDSTILTPKEFKVQKNFASTVEKKNNTYNATKTSNNKTFSSELHPKVAGEDYDWIIYDGGGV